MGWREEQPQLGHLSAGCFGLKNEFSARQWEKTSLLYVCWWVHDIGRQSVVFMKEEASQPPLFVQLGWLLWRDRAVGVANSCLLSRVECYCTYLSGSSELSVIVDLLVVLAGLWHGFQVSTVLLRLVVMCKPWVAMFKFLCFCLEGFADKMSHSAELDLQYYLHTHVQKCLQTVRCHVRGETKIEYTGQQLLNQVWSLHLSVDACRVRECVIISAREAI